VLAFHAAPNFDAETLEDFVAGEAEELSMLWDRGWLVGWEEPDRHRRLRRRLAGLKRRLDRKSDGVGIRHVLFGHTVLERFRVEGFRGKQYRIGRLLDLDERLGVPALYNLLTSPRDVPPGGALGGLEISGEAVTAVYGQPIQAGKTILPDREVLGEGEPAFRG
jgi:hypothetical protein